MQQHPPQHGHLEMIRRDSPPVHLLTHFPLSLCVSLRGLSCRRTPSEESWPGPSLQDGQGVKSANSSVCLTLITASASSSSAAASSSSASPVPHPGLQTVCSQSIGTFSHRLVQFVTMRVSEKTSNSRRITAAEATATTPQSLNEKHI